MRYAPALGLVLFLLLGLAGCAQPPQREIEAARSAVEAARADTDVTLYAPDSLRAAEESLAALQAEIGIQEKKFAPLRNYDRTAQLAAAAKAAGDSARAQAASARQTAGIEAAALIDSAAATLSAIELKAGQARRQRGIKLDVQAVIASIVEARGMVEAARADLASFSYASSRAKADAARERIDTLDALISEAMLLARKKQ